MALVPLLTCTFTAAPPASPCSASKAFVTTSTVSIASSAGMYAAQKLIHTFTSFAPSIFQLTDVAVVPLTLTLAARAGFTSGFNEFDGGAKPGNVTNAD